MLRVDDRAPRPRAVAGLLREEPRGLADDSRGRCSRRSRNWGPRTSAESCASTAARTAIHLGIPSGRPDHNGNAGRENLVDVCRDGIGARKLNGDIGSLDSREVISPLETRVNREIELGRELRDQAPHLAVSDNGEFHDIKMPQFRVGFTSRAGPRAPRKGCPCHLAYREQ